MIQKQKTKTTLKRLSLIGIAPEQVDITKQKFFAYLQQYSADLGDIYGRTTGAPANGHDVIKLALDSLATSDIYLAIVNGKAIGMFHFMFDSNTRNVVIQIYQGVVSTNYLPQFLTAAVDQAFEKSNANKLKAEPLDGSQEAQIFQACGFEIVGHLKYERLIGGQYVDTILLERLNPSWFEYDDSEEEIEIELDFDAAIEEERKAQKKTAKYVPDEDEDFEDDEAESQDEDDFEEDEEEPAVIVNPAKKPAIKKPAAAKPKSSKVAVVQPVWDPIPKRRKSAPEFERLKTV